MPPLLAREAVTAAALSGDTAAVLDAHAALTESDAPRYDRRRAAAFVSALAGERTRALRELGLGAGARSLRLGVDAAVIELLTRGPAEGLGALRAALRDGAHSEPDVPLVLAECVRRSPECARTALVVAVSGGSWAERVLAAGAVVRAVRPAPAAAVPVLVAVSLAIVVVGFVRLPGPGGDAGPTVAPTLGGRTSPVILARPSGPVRATLPRGGERSRQELAVAARRNSIGALFRDGTRSTAAAAPAREAAFPSRLRQAPGSVPKPSPAPPPPARAPAPPADATRDGAAPASAPAPAPAETTAAAESPPLDDEPSRVSKAARKAAKLERKAGKSAAKTDAATTSSPAAAVTPPASDPQAPPEHAAEHGRDEKPEKPEKPEKSK